MSEGLFDQSAGLRALRSGELAKLASVTVRTLRHYRTIGLLPDPPRDENGYCSYGIEDLVRVLRIKRLASLGFSLDDIKGMLDDMDAVTSSVQKASTADAAQAEKAGASEPAANGGSEGGRAAEGAGAPPAPSAADKGPEGNIPQPERVFERLDALDQELKDQIAHLEEQRRTIALLKRERLDVDLPVRAARISKELVGAFDDDTLPRPSESERAALLLMANLYDERSFAEVERISEALVERGLLPAMRAIDVRTAALAPDAAESEIEALAEEVLHVFMQVTDVVDSENWDRDYTFAEQLILAYSSQEFNPAQRALYERLAIGLEALFKNSAKPLDPDATS